jgi:hypothetical protein
MDRYRITLTRDGQRFGILDREQYDYCSLKADDGTVLPLEWHTRPAAEAWLQDCFRIWNSWENNGEGQPPKNWRRRPPEPSPFDRGMRFYS